VRELRQRQIPPLEGVGNFRRALLRELALHGFLAALRAKHKYIAADQRPAWPLRHSTARMEMAAASHMVRTSILPVSGTTELSAIPNKTSLVRPWADGATPTLQPRMKMESI